jgi:tripartite-type tricarboxylate transporter receptor subunit TctC
MTVRNILAQARMAFAGTLAALASLPGGPADASDFFSGKTVRLIVPAGPAGGYGLYGLLVANHLGRFIPGQPNVVASHLPGGAGLNAMNYLFEVAPRDGSAIAVLMQDLAPRQALAAKGVRFDATKFNYIGRATANVPVHMVWHLAQVKSIDDLKTREILTGASGTAGTQIDLPRAQNALIGTKWKVIPGYQTGQMRIAMERGEVQASVAPATLFNNQFKPWLDQAKVNVVVQYADFRHPILPDVPAVVELAKAEEAKRVFKFLVSMATVGRAYAAPPGVPAKRVAILRKAFDAMMNDPAFKADAAKRGADLMPMAGEELAAHVKDIVATPPNIIRKTNEVIAAK